jgi:patatin-related protein
MIREKELRLALVCYGGISLAVYMHGVTKEIWRLARASRAFRDADEPSEGSESVYRSLLQLIEEHGSQKLSVFADIITGASAGGINGVFLAQAIATGQSLDPLTDLWLETADVEKLLDPAGRSGSTFSKLWAHPLAAMAAKRGGAADDVDPEARDEVRSKLVEFVRSRWFSPPFGGAEFTNLLLDALDAMAKTTPGPRLLPPGQPLDLTVTVTDFHGHPQRVRLNSPAEIVETEHRLTIGFSQSKATDSFADLPELAFACRATASFPGAFPPFSVVELDRVLADRQRVWPGREAFLARALPAHFAAGQADRAVLIDGSVLANAPFRPAFDAVKNRPARRELDRRFVYIDPKPGRRSISFGSKGDELPGFFGTLIGALSEIPREQPIRDTLDSIEGRSARVTRIRRIVESLRTEVEETIDTLYGRTFFLDRPTPARLAAWRSKAQNAASRQAGPAYPAYGHLKLVGIVEEVAGLFERLRGRGTPNDGTTLRDSLWDHVHDVGLDRITLQGGGATDAAILFFRQHDLGFRIRRLRSLARRLIGLTETGIAPADGVAAMRDALFGVLALYLDRETASFYPDSLAQTLATGTIADAMDRLAQLRDLKALDDEADERMAEALAALPRAERREMLLAYLGFPFYDIATLSLMQGEAGGEFDPIKVDRIAPDDCTSIRAGGAEATLKGIRFNSFGAFFSRAYRENDYLWGRLHGAERVIDIVVSTLPGGVTLPAGVVATLKTQAFRAIIAEEKPRLAAIRPLFDQLEAEIG